MRIPIGRLMISVALLAVSLSVVVLDVKHREVHRHAHDLVVGVLPMATILAYTLLGASIDLVAGRPSRRYRSDSRRPAGDRSWPISPGAQ